MLLLLFSLGIPFAACEGYVRHTRPHVDLMALTGRTFGKQVPHPMADWAIVDAFSWVVTLSVLPLRTPPPFGELQTIRVKSAPGAHVLIAASIRDCVLLATSNQSCHHYQFADYPR